MKNYERLDTISEIFGFRVVQPESEILIDALTGAIKIKLGTEDHKRYINTFNTEEDKSIEYKRWSYVIENNLNSNQKSDVAYTPEDHELINQFKIWQIKKEKAEKEFTSTHGEDYYTLEEVDKKNVIFKCRDGSVLLIDFEFGNMNVMRFQKGQIAPRMKSIGNIFLQALKADI
jgi:hypothetical protein